MKDFIDKLVFGKSKNVLPEIRHLPRTLIHAVWDMRQNRELNRILKEKHLADNLVLVAALPKSASSVIGTGVAIIFGQGGGNNRRRYARYMLGNQTSNLRPEMAKDFRKGGVLKYHPKASTENLNTIELLGIRYIILFRDPADHIAAFFCHLNINYQEQQNKPTIDKPRIFPNHIFPIERKYFEMAGQPDKQINYLINGGYLFSALSFMTDWLRFRSNEKSLIARYEDFADNSTNFFNNISNFLIGQNITKETKTQIETTCNNAVRYSEEKNSFAYPRGYSGKIGTWKNYFNKKNRSDFNRVVKSFLESYPDASRLLDVYPDIMKQD